MTYDLAYFLTHFSLFSALCYIFPFDGKFVNVNRFILQALDERHQKYKMMEGNLMARKRRLKSQLPDITSSLTLINKLRAKKDANEETNSQFLLSDSVYASAKIPPTDKVTFTFQSCIFCSFIH